MVLEVLIFMGVIALTAVIFGGWVIVTLVRVLFRGVGALFAPPSLPPMPGSARGVICDNGYCRAVNPGTARFCRRCGRQLPEAQRVQVRRAAMW
jgi:hypothetical protein